MAPCSPSTPTRSAGSPAGARSARWRWRACDDAGPARGGRVHLEPHGPDLPGAPARRAWAACTCRPRPTAGRPRPGAPAAAGRTAQRLPAVHMTVRVGDPSPRSAPATTGASWTGSSGRRWPPTPPASLVFNGQRYLDFRLDDDNEQDFPKDPALLRQGRLLDRLRRRPPGVARRDGDDQLLLRVPIHGTNYYGTTQGPPFTISAPTRPDRLGRQRRRPARLPGLAAHRAVDHGDRRRPGRAITIPFALQAGQQVIIDTEAQTIVDGYGNNPLAQDGVSGRSTSLRSLPGNRVRARCRSSSACRGRHRAVHDHGLPDAAASAGRGDRRSGPTPPPPGRPPPRRPRRR
jgi:hypothetical protein